MSPTLIALVAAAWIGIGLTLSFVLGRRGHDGFSWFILGVVLGPLAIALAVDSWRNDERPQTRTLAMPAMPATPSAPAAAPRGTGVDVLVGFDGSPESRAAVSTAVELFADRLGRLTLVTVIPYDGGRDAERDAVTALDREATRLGWLAPGLEVVHGHASQALTEATIAGGYDLLVIGTKGAGRAHLFGSAASELARNSKVPVLLVGSGGRRG